MSPTVPLPSNTTYGKIVGRYVLAVGDGNDVDSNPDGVAAKGTVVFTPSPTRILNPAATVPTTVAPQPVNCTFDSDGDIVGPNGEKGVWLVATDSPGNPASWTYKVRILFDGLPTPITFDISVAGGSTTDLTVLTPVPSDSGTYYLIGPPGPQGDVGPQGAPGVADDPSLTAIDGDGASSFRVQQDARHSAAYATKATQTTVESGRLSEAELSATYVPNSQKGAASGIASLDFGGNLTPAQLPDRLSSFPATVADADEALENGWYRVNGPTGLNAPDTVNVFLIDTRNNASDSGYVIQTARAFAVDSSADTKVWRRERNAYVWGSWYRLRESEAELNTLYLVPAASTTTPGRVELATTAETATGTDAVRAVTPAGAAARYQPIAFSKAFTTPYSAVEPVQNIQITSKNTGTVSQRRAAYRAQVSDATGVNQVNITGATNASPIVITATAHGYATGDKVTVQGVGGNTAANGIWTITVLTANTFSLNGSTGNGAFTSGGFVTNRSMLTGMVVEIGCSVTRGGLTGAAQNGDDMNGVTVENMGAGMATDAFYVAALGGGWLASFNTDASGTLGFRAGGTYTKGAAEFCGAILIGAPSGAFGAGDVRLYRTGAAALKLDDGAAGPLAMALVGSLTLESNPGTGTDTNLILNVAGLGSRRVSIGAADSAGVGYRTVRVLN